MPQTCCTPCSRVVRSECNTRQEYRGECHARGEWEDLDCCQLLQACRMQGVAYQEVAYARQQRRTCRLHCAWMHDSRGLQRMPWALPLGRAGWQPLLQSRMCNSTTSTKHQAMQTGAAVCRARNRAVNMRAHMPKVSLQRFAHPRHLRLLCRNVARAADAVRKAEVAARHKGARNAAFPLPNSNPLPKVTAVHCCEILHTARDWQRHVTFRTVRCRDAYHQQESQP